MNIKHTAIHPILLWALALLTILMTTNNLHAETLKPYLYKKTLDNGLTLLVKDVPGSKVVTVQIWVKAGSIYEEPREAGITHFIEHMIFKGTETLGPGELAGVIEENGGRINAYTSYEYTVYHATLSARHWATALDVLTDALLHSVFDADELEREKPVVLEEIRMRNDRPTVKLFEELMHTAYKNHPYRLPVIGTVESVSSFTHDDIKNYMTKHYRPENFAVVIVGDVRFKPVLAEVEKLFGNMANQGTIARDLPAEPEQISPRLFSLEDDIKQSHMALAFPIPSFSDDDTPVIDVISDILGKGETSRLYNELRNEKGLVYSIEASAFTPKYSGLLEVLATLDEEKISPALEAALEEIFKLKYIPVDDEELNRVKKNLESDFIFNLEKVEGQARILGTFEFLAGDPREDEYLEKVQAVTREDILRVANKYFSGRKLTVGTLAPNGNGFTLDQTIVSAAVKKAEQTAKDQMPSSLVENSYLSNVHRFVLDNGTRLLVREDPQVPTVAIRAVFPGGLRGETDATNGAFAFISDLLPKSTEELGSRQLALKIADLAGDISGFNGKNTFGLKASFLARYFQPGLQLITDILRHPVFDPNEAEKIRPERLNQLKRQEDSLPSLAFREFNKLLFQGHPYGLNQPGKEEVLKQISAAELKKIYKHAAHPSRLVLGVAGKVKAEEVFEAVNALFGSWKADGVVDSNEEFLPPEAPPSPNISQIVKEKEQTHIVIGFLGAGINSPDRYALEVLETILSGQSGRLFRELRDKQSLAYSLSSFTTLGVDTGAFGIYIGTSPDKKEAAIQGAWQELYKLRTSPVDREELEKAKNVLIGHYELQLQTHDSQALDMTLMEEYNLGQDFGNRYIHEVSQVAAEDVLEAARRYIQSEHYVLVTVGAE
jgi:zinc protease